MKNINPYKEFRNTLVAALDSIIKKEAGKLESAINRELLTSDNPGEAFLLVEAGLVRCLGDQGSLHSCEYFFEATQKGIEAYQSFINGKENFKKQEEEKPEKEEYGNLGFPGLKD